jgi:type I restriction enzyme S subunit
VKLETFFEKFDLFADTPGAVAKLRELVLELAVRGRLSEHRPGDHNDSTWRSFLEDFERRLYAKDPTPAPPFEIPDDWRWVCIDDVADACGQKKPDAPFTYIDVASIDNERGVIKTDLEVVAPEQAPSRARKLVQRGTVIYATVRPYLKNIAVVDCDFSPSAIVSTAFAILHPRSFVNGRFLFYWLRTKSFEAEIADRMKGVAYPAINDGEFRGCPVPLPPLAEQKRIVAKVDELMALCDQLETQQQERDKRHAVLARASLARFADAPTPANLTFLFHPSYAISPADLRKSILTLAIQGKLVPQDPNDEPAETTFPKLLAVAIKTDEDAFPAHWLRVPLGTTGEWRGGGTPSKSRPEFWAGDLPWVSPKDMKVLYISDAQDHISNAAVENSSVRLIPPGSLLMVVRGMILARAFPVALTTREVTINQDMKALLPSDSRTKDFLLVMLRALEPDILAAIEHSSHGTCKLKTDFLRDFAIPIPPLAEQRRIVAKVDKLMALVDKLETQLASSRPIGADLMEAVIAELMAAA